ncbi:MAG: Mannosyltransferase [Methanobacteriaceae archaeon 41_258]|nr:MAG: Mannosyltransferase [Methanobacteriaceae archaeon 41_258]
MSLSLNCSIMKDVTFIIPAYNEEKSIGHVIEKINRLYQTDIIVIDNNSSDRTAEIAEEKGALVVKEKRQGKARAIFTGFKHLKKDYAVMMDADGTYSPEDSILLISLLKSENADVALGSRVRGEREDDAISTINLIGNFILSLTASILYQRVSDVCTGHWAFTKKAIQYILKRSLNYPGFELEAEMFSKFSKAGFKIVEAPISYKCRRTEPKLSSIKDGFKIFKTLLIERIK